MPSILRWGRYRFFFFSNEGREPPHIHVKAGEDEAKFWLDPVEICRNYGFNERELSTIQGVIVENRESLLESWDEFFGQGPAQANP